MMWIRADAGLAEQFRMIGHHGKVEWPRKLDVSARLAVREPWLNTQRRTFGKLVGLIRRRHRALCTGIQ